MNESNLRSHVAEVKTSPPSPVSLHSQRLNMELFHHYGKMEEGGAPCKSAEYIFLRQGRTPALCGKEWRPSRLPPCFHSALQLAWYPKGRAVNAGTTCESALREVMVNVMYLGYEFHDRWHLAKRKMLRIYVPGVPVIYSVSRTVLPGIGGRVHRRTSGTATPAGCFRSRRPGHQGGIARRRGLRFSPMHSTDR